MNHQELLIQLTEAEKLRSTVINFDPSLKVEFDDESDLVFELDSKPQGELKE